MPIVEGWQPQVPRPTRAFIAHRRSDPIMEHRARALLEEAGMDIDYPESKHGQWIEPAHAAATASVVLAVLVALIVSETRAGLIRRRRVEADVHADQRPTVPPRT